MALVKRGDLFFAEWKENNRYKDVLTSESYEEFYNQYKDTYRDVISSPECQNFLSQYKETYKDTYNELIEISDERAEALGLNINITGIYKAKNVYNCSIDSYEWFVLYNSINDFNEKFYKGPGHNCIGEFYSTISYACFRIIRYNISGDVLTLYIKFGSANNASINSEYEYKYQFKISDYQCKQHYTLTCIYREYNELLTINEGAIIILEYYGDTIEEAWYKENNE